MSGGGGCCSCGVSRGGWYSEGVSEEDVPDEAMSLWIEVIFLRSAWNRALQ